MENLLLNNNLLNNQNYILGKSEKKKLLSRFFVDKLLFFIYKILNNVKQNIKYEKIILYFFFFPFLFSLLLPLFYKSDINTKECITLVNFIFIFLIFVVLIFIYSIFSKFKHKKYISNKDVSLIRIFYSKKYNIFSIIFFLSLVLIFIIIIHTRNECFLIKNTIFYYIFYFVLFFILFFRKYTFFIFKINIIQLIFLPLYLIIFSFFFIWNIIYIFILKWINWYNLIKIKPESNILKKFNIINKQSAENDTYKIKVKA